MAILGAQLWGLFWQALALEGKELKLEMRLAGQTAKNLQGRRLKLALRNSILLVPSDQAARHLSHDDLLTILPYWSSKAVCAFIDNSSSNSSIRF